MKKKKKKKYAETMRLYLWARLAGQCECESEKERGTVLAATLSKIQAVITLLGGAQA